MYLSCNQLQGIFCWQSKFQKLIFEKKKAETVFTVRHNSLTSPNLVVSPSASSFQHFRNYKYFRNLSCLNFF